MAIREGDKLVKFRLTGRAIAAEIVKQRLARSVFSIAPDSIPWGQDTRKELRNGDAELTETYSIPSEHVPSVHAAAKELGRCGDIQVIASYPSRYQLHVIRKDQLTA